MADLASAGLGAESEMAGPGRGSMGTGFLFGVWDAGCWLLLTTTMT